MRIKLIFLAELAALFGLYLILLYEMLAWIRNFLAFWAEVGRFLGWIAIALSVSLPGNLEGGGEPPKPQDPGKRLRSKLLQYPGILRDERGRNRMGEVMKEL